MRSGTPTLLILVAILAGCSTSAQGPSAAAAEANVAGERQLLVCDVFGDGHGPDQRVSVLRRGAGLVLEELTSDDIVVERPLESEEWDRSDLKLRSASPNSPDEANRLYKLADGGWMYESVGGDWPQAGHAYCWIDVDSAKVVPGNDLRAVGP